MRTIRSLFALIVLLAPFCDIKAQILGPILYGKAQATTYVGPGDIVAAYAWWGLRCYSTSYAGNVADIYSPADASHTLLTCSSGGVLNETLQALSITCAISCTVKTLYDQSGNTNCLSATPCDLAQATEASRYSVTLNCQNSHPCIALTPTPNMRTVPTGTITIPFVASMVAIRTSNFTTPSNIFGSGTGLLQLGFNNSANQVFGRDGSQINVTAADSAWHAVQFLANDTSSAVYVDGANTTGSAGSGSQTGSLCLGDSSHCIQNAPNGNFAEGGIYNSDISANFSALNANQHTYWGF